MKSLLIALMLTSTGVATSVAYIAHTNVEAARELVALQDQQIDELRQSTEDLQSQLHALAARPTRGPLTVTTPVAASEKVAVQADESGPSTAAMRESATRSPDWDTTEAELAAGLDDRSSSGSGNSGMREQVRLALAEIQEEQEEEERSRRRDQRVDRMKSRISRYSERLHLQPSQEEEMLLVMTESREAQGNLWRQVRDGEIERGEVRELMSQSRDEANAEIEKILTTDQYAEYQIIQAEDRDNRGNQWGRGRSRNNRGAADTSSSSEESTPRRGS